MSDIRDLAGAFMGGWSRRDPDAIADVLAAAFVDHDPVEGQASGRAGYKEMTAAYFAAFPDLCVRTEDVIVEKDKAAVRWTATGSHGGDLMGIPATGREVRLKGVDILRAQGGLLVERWGEFDALSMLRQLGLAA